MKSKLRLDQFADLSTLPDHLRGKIKFKPGVTPGGKTVAVAYFPAGTEFEGPQALALCRTGQAQPADDECATALNMTDAQRLSMQVEYDMDNKGINKPEDRTLYRAGVILGYDEKLNYIHGPNWEAYQAALTPDKDEEI